MLTYFLLTILMTFAFSIHIIAVPTPINNAKKPDLGALKKATETVGMIIKSQDTVIYESTVYPGLLKLYLYWKSAQVSNISEKVHHLVK